MRRRGAILLSAAVVVVLAVSVWVVPESASPLPATPDSRTEPSAVVSGAGVLLETVSSAPRQTLERWSRLPDRHGVLLPVAASFLLLVAMAVFWQRPVPIAGRVLERDRGRAMAARAPPPRALFPAVT